MLLKEFAGAFGDANKVFLMPIYSAGEKPIEGVSSENLAKEIARNGVLVQLAENPETVLQKEIGKETVFLTLGAGDDYHRRLGEIAARLVADHGDAHAVRAPQAQGQIVAIEPGRLSKTVLAPTLAPAVPQRRPAVGAAQAQHR